MVNPDPTALFGPDDLVALGVYYAPSFAICLALSLAAAAILWRSKRRRPERPVASFLLTFAPGLPMCAWIAHIALSYRLACTLVLLDSEGDWTAQIVYENRLRAQVTDLGHAVRLACSRAQPPNVRFYAACLVADNLATNNRVQAKRVLDTLDSAPIIHTQFMGGNGITVKFYVPGRPQPHLEVREVVEQRLQDLREKQGRKIPNQP
jgi:hypothetical protein